MRLQKSIDIILAVHFHLGTIVFKVFGKVEHKGKVTGYNPVTKLYQIVYDDDDTEQYYHNEVRDQQKRSLSKRRQWKQITYIRNMLLRSPTT